jgi:DNA polymerase III delta prime subunit
MFNEWYINDCPTTLDQVWGQDLIVKYYKERLLKNSFDKSTLFIGQFGSGKTVMAKILAMAIATPEKDKDEFGNPNLDCLTCRSVITEKFDRDVIYIDAEQMSASDIRDVVSSFVATPAMRDANKVLICDEAQALSKEALEAFLTATQSPKKGFYFIFTAMSKLQGAKSGALESRCKKFRMVEPSPRDAYLFLADKCKKYGLVSDPEVPKEFFGESLQFIAENCQSSYRLALQMLQQTYDAKVWDIPTMAKLFAISSEENVRLMIKNLSHGIIDETVWNCITGKDFNDDFPLFLKIVSDASVYKAFGGKYIDSDDKWRWNQAIDICNGPHFDLVVSAVEQMSAKPYMKRGDWQIVMSKLVTQILQPNQTRKTTTRRIAE